MGVKGRWRGPGRRGRRAAKAFCLEKQKPKTPQIPSPCGPSGARGPGQMGACGWQRAGSEGELGGGRSGLAEGSSPERGR